MSAASDEEYGVSKATLALRRALRQPKPRKKRVKHGTHKKFFYRVVELGKVSGFVIKRNGYIYAADLHEASDKVNRRWGLTGGGMIEEVIPELDGDRSVYNTCLVYKLF